MKKIICTLLWLGAQLSHAQPVVNNAGEFAMGTVLKFKNCFSGIVYAGSGGANMLWDYSLLSETDSLITTIVPPASTTAGSLFPMAAIAERNSDKTINYISRGHGKSFLEGFADTGSNQLLMQYQRMIQTQENPVTFGTIITGSFVTTYTLNNMGQSFRGGGTYTLQGDAYGTLMLPNGTSNNVLRVRLSSVSKDTMNVTGDTYTTSVVNYMFFDGIHTSSLLNIDSVNSGNFEKKSVKYLYSESNSPALGIATQQQSKALFICYPNPASGHVNIITSEKGLLHIKNITGQLIRSEALNGGDTPIILDALNAGVYFIELEKEGQRYVQKLVIY